MDTKIIVAVKAMILYQDSVLIIKRSAKDEVGAGTWEFPGGKLDFGERLTEALRRELREEVQLDVEVIELLYATSFLTDPQRQVVLLSYLCRANSADVCLSIEHEKYLWIKPAQLQAYLPDAILSDIKEHDVLNRIGDIINNGTIKPTDIE